ncbi:uncharacterized protein LOC110870595 [Helianthus annuus]|uniref:uncharacterized protein LOC110870595 n=1 Tax=Helianthus annuus TaxID=4232 RepID=UPI000B902148|nr:uncharacterized protein LOC110870595 [Helianthus annuus]
MQKLQQKALGQCTIDSQAKPCGICKKKGHKTLECKNLKDVVCYGCNEKGHIKINCPKNVKKPDEAKKGNVRAFQLNVKQAVNDENVIRCTFLINDIYARALFDSGADKSFVDLKFSQLLNLPIRTLDIKYEVELADGSLETASTILDGCSISIKNHSIPLSLLPMKLAGFDVVLGMDWLSHNQARTACVSKCLKSGCVIYMAHVTVDEPKPKIEDIPVISDYPNVFPDKLPGLPPERQVEFRIDIMPGAAPVARAPYHLAPTEMQELREQLDELLEKGFI